MPVTTLAVQGGGVAALTAVGTVPVGTGLLADSRSEDDLDLLDFLREVQPCRERAWVQGAGLRGTAVTSRGWLERPMGPGLTPSQGHVSSAHWMQGPIWGQGTTLIRSQPIQHLLRDIRVQSTKCMFYAH